VAGDFAAPADFGSFLDFDKSADLGLIPDFAAIQVRETEDFDAPAQFHRRCNLLVQGRFLVGHETRENPACF
jgi:hypothetical protein